jgi:NAD+ diphosphatase
MSFQHLRKLWGPLPDRLFWAAGTAFQVMDWDRTHRYCSRCGAATTGKPGERAKVCPSCGLVFYPRISPAVIVAVVDGDRILLGRAHRFPVEMYSVIAGFVDPGESLEECVHREVAEETGIRIRNVRYFGSQPWPFPNSLMVGFTAEYAGGELVVDAAELASADWFTASALPRIPDRLSIARRLIDWFVGGCKG